MTDELADSSRRPFSSTAKAWTLVGCGIVWMIVGFAVLAASSMFLVNPAIDAGAWLLGMVAVWLGIFIAAAAVILRARTY